MLRYFTAGESHGEALVAFLSGLPAGLKVDPAFIDRELWRRQQGYGRGGRMKIERDTAHILSGVRHGITIGSPISVQLENRDWKNWQEALPVGDRRFRPAQACSISPPRARRSRGRSEIQFPGSPLCFGARVGQRIGGARRHRSPGKNLSARTRHRSPQSRHCHRRS